MSQHRSREVRRLNVQWWRGEGKGSGGDPSHTVCVSTEEIVVAVNKRLDSAAKLEL